jgi:hypothetical protein
VTDAELRALLLDCLRLWEVKAQLVPVAEGWEIATAEGAFSIARAGRDLRPVRWFLQTPERREAGRPARAARAAPSIVAALSALRNNLGAGSGQKLRIGAGRGAPAEELTEVGADIGQQIPGLSPMSAIVEPNGR